MKHLRQPPNQHLFTWPHHASSRTRQLAGAWSRHCRHHLRPQLRASSSESVTIGLTKPLRARSAPCLWLQSGIPVTVRRCMQRAVRYRANAQRADFFVHTHRASSSVFGNENYFPPIPIFSPAASPVLRSPSIYYSAYVCLYKYIYIYWYIDINIDAYQYQSVLGPFCALPSNGQFLSKCSVWHKP